MLCLPHYEPLLSTTAVPVFPPSQPSVRCLVQCLYQPPPFRRTLCAALAPLGQQKPTQFFSYSTFYRPSIGAYNTNQSWFASSALSVGFPQACLLNISYRCSFQWRREAHSKGPCDRASTSLHTQQSHIPHFHLHPHR